MFAPDREGFFPALWVQFLSELTMGEREQFELLDSAEKRLEWVAGHPFPRARYRMKVLAGLTCGYGGGQV